MANQSFTSQSNKSITDSKIKIVTYESNPVITKRETRIFPPTPIEQDEDNPIDNS